jgi:hypothetical protein
MWDLFLKNMGEGKLYIDVLLINIRRAVMRNIVGEMCATDKL